MILRLDERGVGYLVSLFDQTETDGAAAQSLADFFTTPIFSLTFSKTIAGENSALASFAARISRQLWQVPLEAGQDHLILMNTQEIASRPSDSFHSSASEE